MQLLNLINGFPGAPSGTAEVFVSGSTASLATVYADAAGAATLTNPVVLDASGSATAYVDTTVDVVIKTSTGAIAKARHTPEIVDAMIETSGPSFTGANPVTGALAVNQPIGLDTVLDRWVTSAGAPDWKVRRTGQAADETLKVAFAAISSTSVQFFNVRTYGALGDGATDDAAAFEAAVAAAILAGGGIVLLPGTTSNYTISRSISVVSPKVSFLGVGPLASVIRITQAAAAVSWTGGVTTGANNSCRGIGFTASSAFAANCVSIASCPGFTIANCRFSSVSTASVSATCRINVRDCTFSHSGAGAEAITFSTAGNFSTIDGCVLEATSTVSFLTAPRAQDIWVNNCTHESGATSTSLVTMNVGLGYRMRITNCHALTGKWILDGSGGSMVLIESGNTYADAPSVVASTVGGLAPSGSTPSVGTGSKLLSRTQYVAVAAAGIYTPKTDHVVHDLTITAILTITAPTGISANGDQLVFIVFNNTAGALNVTWNAAYNVTATPTSVTANQRMRLEFILAGGAWRALDTAQVFA